MIENGIWEKYEKKELIGSGSYGNAYKALNKDIENYVAIKEIKGFGSFSLFGEIKIFGFKSAFFNFTFTFKHK